MALTFNDTFDAELRKLIDAEIERRSENLAVGTSAQDFPAYKHEVGYVLALKWALDQCDEVQTILAKR